MFAKKFVKMTEICKMNLAIICILKPKSFDQDVSVVYVPMQIF